LPFKLDADRRRHVPKRKFKVTNGAAYDASLRQRGRVTVWLAEATIAAWTVEPRTTRGGQRTSSALAILTALTLRAAFRLALHRTQRLIGSVIGLLGLDLAVADHSTLSRRAETPEVPRSGTSTYQPPYVMTAQGKKQAMALPWTRWGLRPQTRIYLGFQRHHAFGGV